MSFLHPALLSLAALAVVPVILHFLMRPKPKRLLFPALRLIESRRKTNVRRLRLRHIWLLLLRIAIIALLVISIARPLVPAAHYGLTTRESLSLIAIAVTLSAVYAALVRWWGHVKDSPRHEFLYRRTISRAVVGVAAALLVLMLVIWPYARRVSAEVADPGQILAEDRPVAAVFVFDTSRSMEYQYEGASRLEAAKRIALQHLASLPAGSRVAVTDSTSKQPAVYQADLAAAKSRIESLETHAVHRPLDERIRIAFDLQEQDRDQGIAQQSSISEELRRDNYVRAVYVFTDFASTAWSDASSGTLRERLESQRWLQLFLLDVGIEEPINTGLTLVRPSKEILISGNRGTLRVNVFHSGTAPEETTVELYTDGQSGPVKRNQATVKPNVSGGGGLVEFPIPEIEGALVQGELRLTRSDPFTADNVRYFSVTVEPAPKVLVASDRSDDGFIWSEALRSLQFDVSQIGTSKLETQQLDDFDAVYLINATAPTKEAWQRLVQYVRGGGGLGVVLGKRVDPVLYNGDAAQSILPARLLTQVAFNPPELFRPIDDGHPVFERFKDFDGGYGWLTNRDVKRHYVVEPNQGSGTIAAYTFAKEMRPALLLRSSENGRVAMLTTGVDTTEGWSDLALAGLPYLVFSEQLTQFIAGRSGGRRNFVAGEQITLHLGRETIPPKLLLRTPQFEQLPLEAPQDGRRLLIDDVRQVGHYDITAPGTDAFLSGFSTNLHEGESDFTRSTPAELDTLFGEARYSVSRDAQNLAVVVRDTTLGAELMPYILIVLTVVFCGEHLVANRFYENEQAPEHR